MSLNFSKLFAKRRLWLAIGLPLWVLASFILAQIIAVVITEILQALGVLNGINEAVYNSAAGALMYILTIAMVIGLPLLVKHRKTTKAELGLDRSPEWLDLLLAPAGFIVYIALSALLVYLAGFLQFIDLNQVQDTGFNDLFHQFEFGLAFLMLVIIAPLAEEILFRGYLFGKLLKNNIPVWISILITSILFALVHAAWNVGIDVFALSVVLCLLRVVSKSLWPSILLHMMKNFVAFYILFINPTLFNTLGG